MTMSRVFTRLAVAIALILQVHAFSPDASSSVTRRRRGELRMVWSMPNPPSMNSLSWYTEEASVIKSSIVYDDEPLDYSFATPGDDWFSSMETQAAVVIPTGRVRRMNPIRRAVRWARQGLRRS